MFWNNSEHLAAARPAASLRADGDDDERCEAGNENSTAAEAAVVAVDTVKRPSGSITRAYVRERRRTREECFFVAREKSQQRLARVMRRTTDEEKRSGGY